MKAWTDKSEFKDLKSELFHLERRAFERRMAELLRIRWPECRAVSEMHPLDRGGTDIYVWHGGGDYAVAVQAKGYEVSEPEIGSEQAAQVLKSIESFAASDIRADSFFVVINREARKSNFREPVTDALRRLEGDGRVRVAALWDLKKTLSEIFNAMAGRVRDALQRSTRRDAAALDVAASVAFKPLTEVPLTSANLIIDRHAIESEETPVSSVADPALLIVNAADESQMALLIGRAGYGKTSAVRRAVDQPARRVFFIPAARIDRRIVGTKDLLELCLDVEDLFEDCSDAERAQWRRIARPVLEDLFKRKETQALLIFDALDEAPFLNRERGAFQHFFNFFNAIRIPVVLTARTEFWTGKRDDLQRTFGMVGAHKGGPRKRIRLIELVDWRETEMIEFASRYRTAITDGETAARIDDLISAFASGQYERYYGDIPRRPLFLRMILDTVAAADIHHVRRSDLFREWAELKVRRDTTESQIWRTEGRPSIAGEATARENIQLAFAAMTAAAEAMTERLDGRVVLLPDCAAETVYAADPRIERNAMRIALNTLLIEIQHHASDPARFAFAHRAFQEYFLARAVAGHPQRWTSVRLDDDVAELVAEIASGVNSAPR